ncbi:hypothetical protein PENTCL1PPCAC_26738 [Pristionchus entomophagus]|uniref:non-specific serine/threonine protein kinase n=1 Tax=Pristionchus entomophagus TaxID=358040 RepID=A0AAV5UC95_9BILA|nr:hypothetical protein PENTCL1PPCAC_26738 [Pristionchus entomophagus]
MVSSTSFVRSSTTFKEKIELPASWRFRDRVSPSIVFDTLEVRRHTGFFWSRRRGKECVLIDNGRLLIYSSFDRGLSISLPELSSLRFSVSAKEVVGREDNSMICEVEMRRGKERLILRIRGSDKVSRWRDAIVRASQGLSPKGEVEGSAKNGYSWSWRGSQSTARRPMDSEATITPGTLTNQSPKEDKKRFDMNSNISPLPVPPPSLLSFSIDVSHHSLSYQSSIDNDENTVPPPSIPSPIVPSRKLSVAPVSSSILSEDETTIYRSALSHRENSLPRLRAESLLLRSLCDQSILRDDDDEDYSRC